MRKYFYILLFIAGFTSCAKQTQLPRIIVCTDINNVGGDPDDKQSMAHLLMYANEVEILSIIPDYWNGKGVEASMQAIDAYEKDYYNPEFNFQKLKYPEPDKLRVLIQTNRESAVNSIISEAKKNEGPVHVLIWGGMNTVKNALQKAPEIAHDIRIYTIATHRMAANQDAQSNSKDTVQMGIRNNWNGRGRNEIYLDERFKQLWWLENDWAYNGMFEGQQPGEFLLEIKTYGALGYHIWEVVQSHKWAHYFRAGDTPTLVYLLEPDVNIADPLTSTWAGKFIKPYPAERPNSWIDNAGIKEWDYANPENSWKNAEQVYKNRVNSLLQSRNTMYNAYREKMKELYNR